MIGIDGLQNQPAREPQLSIGRSRRSGKRSSARLRPIKHVEQPRLDPRIRMVPPVCYLLFLDLNKPALRVNPEVALSIQDGVVGYIAWEPDLCRESDLLSASPSDES